MLTNRKMIGNVDQRKVPLIRFVLMWFFIIPWEKRRKLLNKRAGEFIYDRENVFLCELVCNS